MCLGFARVFSPLFFAIIIFSMQRNPRFVCLGMGIVFQNGIAQRLENLVVLGAASDGFEFPAKSLSKEGSE